MVSLDLQHGGWFLALTFLRGGRDPGHCRTWRGREGDRPLPLPLTGGGGVRSVAVPGWEFSFLKTLSQFICEKPTISTCIHQFNFKSNWTYRNFQINEANLFHISYKYFNNNLLCFFLLYNYIQQRIFKCADALLYSSCVLMLVPGSRLKTSPYYHHWQEEPAFWKSLGFSSPSLTILLFPESKTDF